MPPSPPKGTSCDKLISQPGFWDYVKHTLFNMQDRSIRRRWECLSFEEVMRILDIAFRSKTGVRSLTDPQWAAATFCHGGRAVWTVALADEALRPICKDPERAGLLEA